MSQEQSRLLLLHKRRLDETPRLVTSHTEARSGSGPTMPGIFFLLCLCPFREGQFHSHLATSSRTTHVARVPAGMSALQSYCFRFRGTAITEPIGAAHPPPPLSLGRSSYLAIGFLAEKKKLKRANYSFEVSLVLIREKGTDNSFYFYCFLLLVKSTQAATVYEATQ